MAHPLSASHAVPTVVVSPLWLATLRGVLAPPRPRSRMEEVDWAYHQQVVDMIVAGLTAAGNILIVEVDLRSDTSKTARADIMGGRCGMENAVIEVKTSLSHDDYQQFTGDAFRRSQPEVLSLIPVGGRVRSSNAKVARIGLVPNVAFPPMRLDMVYALPGQPYRFRSLPAGEPVPPELPL